MTLRAADYPPALAQQVEAIQGAQAVQGTEQLAPTQVVRPRAARAPSAPATAEQIQRSKGKVGAGDEVGQFGLEARYQERLAGTPTRRIVIRSRTGAPVATLLSRPGRKGRELRTTLDRPVQAAAEVGARRHQAEGGARRRPALDGRRPRRRQPAHRLGLRPRARRPLRARLDVQGRHHGRAAARRPEDDRTVDCPKTITVERQGRSRTSRARPPARCRSPATSRSRATPRSSRSPAPDARRAHAHRARLRPRPHGSAGAGAAAGRDAVERAATMIGQDRIVASPLAMAGVAATVADGRWRAPRLRRDRPARRPARRSPGRAATRCAR